MSSNVAPGFVVEERPEGRALVATGAWTDEAVGVLEHSDVDALELNYARGFSETDLEFLEPWSVQRLLVLDRKQTDLSPISRLAATLKELRVQAAPTAVLDLGRLPRLNALSAHWELIRETISEAENLRQLTVMRYGEDDLDPLASNERLILITLKEASALESLAGADQLHSLEKLGVFRAPFLHDVTALRRVDSSLRDLEFEDCMGIESLEDISDLTKLTWLGISNCGPIDSLTHLESLRDLETLYAWGTTRISDNDLSPLTRLPKLNQVRMRDRRDYQPRLSEVEQMLVNRSA